MADFMTVTLPDGRVLTGIPIGTPKESIEDKLISSGKYTYEDFGRTPPSPVPADNTPVEEPGWFTRAVDWKKKNMEIGGGLVGGIGGAALGAPLGPPGIIGGMILGGMAGSGGGSLLSDVFEGEELNYANAVNEALISGGTDIALLGMGKVLRPGYFAAKEALGFTPKETADQILQRAKLGGEPGSKESLMASQNILMERGATLTPFQTGQATKWEIIKQKIAENGLFSSNIMEQNMINVNRAVSDSIEELIGRAGVDLGADPSILGRNLYQVIDYGKKSLGVVYDRGMNEISQELGAKIVPTAPIKNTLEQFVKESEREFGSMLDPAALKFVQEQIDLLSQVKTMKATSLIDFEKVLKDRITNFGDLNSSVYNGAAERDLVRLSSSLRSSIGDIIEQSNPAAAAKYRALKQEYATGYQGLLPKVNEQFISGASRGHFQELGSMMIGNGTIDQINAMYKSIDDAYALAKKAGTKTMPFGSVDEAKEAVKQGFLRDKFPLLGDEFNIVKYKHLAEQFNTPREAARLRAILGSDYPHVKQLMNLMKEASDNPKSNIGQLVIRTKEYQGLAAGAGMATGFATGGTVTGGASLAAGAGVLVAPVLMAKTATNPKAIAKMLAFERKKFNTTAAMEIAGANLIADLMFSLPEEEQAEVRRALRDELQRETEILKQQREEQSKQQVYQQPMP